MSSELILVKEFIIDNICPNIPPNVIMIYNTLRGVGLSTIIPATIANYSTVVNIVREVFSICTIVGV